MSFFGSLFSNPTPPTSNDNFSLFSNNNIFNNNNNQETKYTSIGYSFKGQNIQEKNGMSIFRSILSNNQFSHLSFEELRLNDYTYIKTGNIPPQPSPNSMNTPADVGSIFGNNNNNTLNFNPANAINQNNGGLFGNSNLPKNNYIFGSDNSQSDPAINPSNKSN